MPAPALLLCNAQCYGSCFARARVVFVMFIASRLEMLIPVACRAPQLAPTSFYNGSGATDDDESATGRGGRGGSGGSGGGSGGASGGGSGGDSGGGSGAAGTSTVAPPTHTAANLSRRARTPTRRRLPIGMARSSTHPPPSMAPPSPDLPTFSFAPTTTTKRKREEAAAPARAASASWQSSMPSSVASTGAGAGTRAGAGARVGALSKSATIHALGSRSSSLSPSSSSSSSLLMRPSSSTPLPRGRARAGKRPCSRPQRRVHVGNRIGSRSPESSAPHTPPQAASGTGSASASASASALAVRVAFVFPVFLFFVFCFQRSLPPPSPPVVWVLTCACVLFV